MNTPNFGDNKSVEKTELKKVLDTISYPINKDQLIQRARQTRVNAASIETLEELPNQMFASSKEVISALGL